MEQQEISLSYCIANAASNGVTRQRGTTLPVLGLVLKSQSACFTLSRQQFLHTNTHSLTHSSKSPFSVFKSALILLGLTKVLQTNIMDNNQLCSSHSIGLFCHAQMTKHNNAVFLIKEEVINLMISSPCVPYKPPTLLTALYLSHPLFVSAWMCAGACVLRDWPRRARNQAER